MTTADHIFVVDDDSQIRSLLSEYLHKEGYRVTTVADGKELRAALATSTPDVIILDLMLPGEDGLTLCRDLRSRSKVPVIMLTARGDATDRVVGLEIGADDYLAKPFNPRELLARIKSVLRRARSLPENLQPAEIGVYRFIGWMLDTATRNLTSPEGVVIALSRSASCANVLAIMRKSQSSSKRFAGRVMCLPPKSHWRLGENPSPLFV
jgi:two-component system, OmpR family, response regulator